MKKAKDVLNSQKDLLKACNKDINERLAEQKELQQDSKAAQLQMQEMEHKISKCNKDAKDAARQVCRKLLKALLQI